MSSDLLYQYDVQNALKEFYRVLKPGGMAFIIVPDEHGNFDFAKATQRSAEIDRTVQTVDQKLNEKIVAGGSGSE